MLALLGYRCKFFFKKYENFFTSDYDLIVTVLSLMLFYKDFGRPAGSGVF